MKEKYLLLFNQIKAVIGPTLPIMSNLANVSALLFTLSDISWAGFYLSNNEYLYLGPFQGEVACSKIPFDKGVCGASYSRKKTIIVDDVNTFKGHIACSNKSKSEIVVPIIKNDKVMGVIDIDSPIYSRFDENEKSLLELVADSLSILF